jgi:Cu/Ag efflux protein CusF
MLEHRAVDDRVARTWRLHDRTFAAATALGGALMSRALGVLLGCLAIGACGGSRSESVEHYKTRGLVVAVDTLPDQSLLTIHHERIDAFKDRDGKASPMDSMKMRFTLADEQSAAELAAGDKVIFEFDVRWSSSSPLQVTRIDELPADTALTLTDH